MIDSATFLEELVAMLLRSVSVSSKAVIAIFLFFSMNNAQSQVIVNGFPFSLNCEIGGITHFFYLSRIDPDGVAAYLTPDRQAGTSIVITIRGKAQPIGGDWSGSCRGKTLEELRSMGLAHYFKN